ncbi:MAG: V-type ATP synthase subunit D [Ruminococcus sp.]|nr:V-type ATP synthase subunit D [Ruminococcus sp.]
MAAQVFPTKGNLIAMKRSLGLAVLGYDLLDRKRNILIRELMSLVDKAGELKDSVEDAYKEAYAALMQANIQHGVITPYAECVPVEDGLKIRSRGVMGVELPTASLDAKPLGVNYGFMNTSAALDRAYLAFNKVKELTVTLAEVESSIYRLSVAIRKTQRRANALQNIIIPDTRAKVKYISDSLEEKEREEFSRLKVIKAVKLRKGSARENKED